MPQPYNTDLSLRIPYDETWKAITEILILHFLAMFLPELYAQLDLSFTPRFIEQEVRARMKGKAQQFVDKLVLVCLQNGETQLVVVHIEFESHPEGIAKRMFDYYCLIKDINPAKLFPDLLTLTSPSDGQKIKQPKTTKIPFDITSLVVYVGNSVPKIHDRYETERFGTKLAYVFNTYIVRDQDEASLKANPNPFSIVILATQYVNKTIGDHETRLSLKEKVYELACERGLNPVIADALLLFIDEILLLPTDLERQFNTHISKIQTNDSMYYITERSLALFDALAKERFGFTLGEAQAAIAAKDSALTKSIVNLYLQKRFTTTEIAEITSLSTDFIVETLRKEGVY